MAETQSSMWEVLQGVRDYASKEAEHIFKPFNRPEGQKFFGAEKGLDFADPVDLVSSTAATAYRAADRLVRWPVVKGGMLLGDKLSGMVGDPINSQEAAEAALDTYDPKGSLAKSGYDIKFHDKDSGGMMEGAGNYFLPKGDNSFFSGLMPGREGVNIKPHKGAPGVEPITLAEEVAHGVRNVTGRNKLKTDGGRMRDYVTRTHEEMGAKGEAITNVFKNEGVLEGLTSIPSVASTALSYLMPSSTKYKLGEIGTINAKEDRLKGREIYHKIFKKHGSTMDLEIDAEDYSDTNNVPFMDGIRAIEPAFADYSDDQIISAMVMSDIYLKDRSKNPVVNDLMDWWDR